MRMPGVDVISLRNGSGTLRDENETAARLDHAFRTHGVVQIVDHGVDECVIESCHLATKSFFAQPEEKKRVNAMPDDQLVGGYIPFIAEESVLNHFGKRVPSDRKEEFCSFPPWLESGKALPEEPAAFARAWQEYFVQAELLCSRILSLLCRPLGVAEEYMKGQFAGHESRLFGMYYPQVRSVETERLRSREHTDWFFMTLIHSSDSVGGLEVLTDDGSWLEVPPRRDAFILNAGDLAAHYTRGRWKAPIHRVAIPPCGSERLSLVYFLQPTFAPANLPDGGSHLQPLGGEAFARYCQDRNARHRQESSLTASARNY